MERITSFEIDHNKLNRGLYVSRKDPVGNTMVTTFDIRMKKPNAEPVIDVPALHTLEHLGATFLRNHETWNDKVLYLGPMGCRTGLYLLLKGDLSSKDALPLIKELFEFIANYKGEVPGAAAVECGNYLSQDLPMARWEAKKYVDEVLEDIGDDRLVYPE
ncbi:MAG: S-ribosylhomocysteine lyase [Spirochaetia bacterium]